MTAHYPDLIAIDGPSASSKTSAGQWLAQKLGYALFDTGLLFRTLSWLLLRDKAPESDQEAWLQNVLADEALLSNTLHSMDQHMRIESVAGQPPATVVYMRDEGITRHLPTRSRVASAGHHETMACPLTALRRMPAAERAPIGTAWHPGA